MKVIQVKESVFANNDKAAENLRKKLTQQGVFMINVMSSPGSGKTTTLIGLINALKSKKNIALMNVDIETSLDADKVQALTGIPTLQIHNGGLCHIDAEMTAQAIDGFGVKNVDLLILENIGNLVCPAEFDTGAHLNVMILSVPEGHDKPLKYPLMFSRCDLIVVNKIDTLPIFDFDKKLCEKYIKNLNPNAKIIYLSAKTGENMSQLADEILLEMNKTNKIN